MKVAIISNLYPPFDRGGAEQVVKKTVEGLLRSGLEVIVITATPQIEEVVHEGKLTIYRITPKNIFFYTDAHRYSFFFRLVWHVCDIFNLSSAWRVRKILQKEQPDVVHTHNLMGLGFLIPRVLRKLHLRHIHTVHDVQLVEPSAMIMKRDDNSWRYRSVFTQVYMAVMKLLLGRPEVVISPSQFLLDFYQSRGFFRSSQTTLLRNPVTFKIEGKKQQKNTHEPFRFFYIGQIEFHKGVLLLVDAFRQLALIHTAIELHIVGNGSLLPEMKERVSGLTHVFVHGRIPRENLPHLFQKMDITVVPSLCYENSPTVIFESFASGVPVLASDIEGVAELIQDHKNGFTFKTGDVDSLTTAMSWCLAHQTEVQIMGEQATALLPGNSEQTYIKTLLSIYRR